MRLVFASNNAHKLAEVRAMMPAGIEVLSLSDIGFEQDIEETGTTLEENSAIKAEAVYHWILDNGHWTVFSPMIPAWRSMPWMGNRVSIRHVGF